MKNNLRKRLLDWCPQPRQPIQTSVTRLSTPVIASVLAVEVILFLVLPAAYYTLLASEAGTQLSGFYGNSESQFPLSARQIAESWPNLPTAKEIVKMGYSYLCIGNSTWKANITNNVTGSYTIFDISNWNIMETSTQNHIQLIRAPLTYTIENCTEVNVFSFRGGIVPRAYRIWLQYNSTIWVEVPQTLLTSTTNPPQPTTEKTGFLGTNLPTAYVILATTIIAATAFAFAGYLISTRKRGPCNTWTPQP